LRGRPLFGAPPPSPLSTLHRRWNRVEGLASPTPTLMVIDIILIYFKMKKNGLDNPCKLLEKLFDSIISPIFLYCCEIWGIYTAVIEKFHMKFIIKRDTRST
jgi:hypothetical protein